MRAFVIAALILVLASSAYSLEKRAFQIKEESSSDQPTYCLMNYYYYIPLHQQGYSWFWGYSGWMPGDIIGEFFVVGDPSMGFTTGDTWSMCDPYTAHTIEGFRVLDLGPPGVAYPGLYTVDFQIWCADERGCPVGPSLWSSGPMDLTDLGWNFIPVTPNLCITKCKTTNNPPGYPRFLITAQMVGTSAEYPMWGFDDISGPVGEHGIMHDAGCYPALYPRPANSHYSTMHSGYYGVNFQHCPPQWFLDRADSTGGNQYGFIELAWRVFLRNSGPTATGSTTWGAIKSLYR